MKQKPQNTQIEKTHYCDISEEEKKLVAEYKKETDEELYQRVREISEQLGRLPNKREVPGWFYLTRRLGPWPRVLEKSGLKKVGPTYAARASRRRNKPR